MQKENFFSCSRDQSTFLKSVHGFEWVFAKPALMEKLGLIHSWLPRPVFWIWGMQFHTHASIHAWIVLHTGKMKNFQNFISISIVKSLCKNTYVTEFEMIPWFIAWWYNNFSAEWCFELFTKGKDTVLKVSSLVKQARCKDSKWNFKYLLIYVRECIQHSCNMWKLDLLLIIFIISRIWH